MRPCAEATANPSCTVASAQKCLGDPSLADTGQTMVKRPPRLGLHDETAQEVKPSQHAPSRSVVAHQSGPLGSPPPDPAEPISYWLEGDGWSGCRLPPNQGQLISHSGGAESPSPHGQTCHVRPIHAAGAFTYRASPVELAHRTCSGDPQVGLQSSVGWVVSPWRVLHPLSET